MNPYSLTKDEKKRHCIIWATIILIINTLDPYDGNVAGQAIGVLVIYSCRIFTYYIIALHILPKFYSNRKLRFIAYTALILASFVILVQVNFFYIIPFFNDEGFSNENTNRFEYTIRSFFSFFFIGACSLVLFLNKKRMLQLNTQSKKERDLLNSELVFLKDQFNNHLTFNFLNFCYRHLYNKSEEAANSIETYAEILNYSLKALPGQNVSLKDEVEYIENFIELQKAISTNVHIIYNCKGDPDNKYITPHILISLVEEAFAKGDINNKLKPIKINIDINDKQIGFKLNYRLMYKGEFQDAAVGRIDIKEILNSFYYNKHKFKEGQKDGTYSGNLILSL